jgi:hypothetical protein
MNDKILYKRLFCDTMTAPYGGIGVALCEKRYVRLIFKKTVVSVIGLIQAITGQPLGSMSSRA